MFMSVRMTVRIKMKGQRRWVSGFECERGREIGYDCDHSSTEDVHVQKMHSGVSRCRSEDINIDGRN